jgi:hypothetical protein
LRNLGAVNALSSARKPVQSIIRHLFQQGFSHKFVFGENQTATQLRILDKDDCFTLSPDPHLDVTRFPPLE